MRNLRFLAARPSPWSFARRVFVGICWCLLLHSLSSWFGDLWGTHHVCICFNVLFIESIADPKAWNGSLQSGLLAARTIGVSGLSLTIRIDGVFCFFKTVHTHGRLHSSVLWFVLLWGPRCFSSDFRFWRWLVQKCTMVLIFMLVASSLNRIVSTRHVDQAIFVATGMPPTLRASKLRIYKKGDYKRNLLVC